ncbi:MAG: LytTR family DNA-binding domain-containing protein [Spirochaetia bacterium]|nr:LytTR family DNA-binding domain-containing protein [Spirochaetia bacterium]
MKVLILEDERPAADRLKALTQEILGKNLTSLKILSSLEEAEIFFQENYIDLLLLDINLQGENGLHYLDRFLERTFHTIIVSGELDYALEAYKYAVIDFIPKPVTSKRLAESIERIYPEKKFSLSAIPVKQENKVYFLKDTSILYIESQKGMTKIFCKEDKEYTTRTTLNSLEEKLSSVFLRVHKSFIVNIKEVENIESESGGNYYAKVTNGETLPIGRSFYTKLKEQFKRAG